MNLKNKITILITFIVLTLIILFVTPEKIYEAILKTPVEFFLLSSLLFTFDICLRAIRWRILLTTQDIDDVHFKELLAPMFSSSLINLVTPARAGDAIRLYALKKNNSVRYSSGLSIIIVEQIITLFSLLIVGLGALLLIIVTTDTISSTNIFASDIQHLVIDLLPIITLIYIIGTTGIILLIFIDAKKFIPILNVFPFPSAIKQKGENFLTIFGDGAKSLRKNPPLLISALIVSSIIWVIEGFIIWLISIALLDSSYEFTITLFASVMGNITFILPILPGSVGTYEFLLGSFLTISQFYTGEDAFLVALVDRGVKTAVLLILGGYSSMILQAQRLKRKEILLEAKEQR